VFLIFVREWRLNPFVVEEKKPQCNFFHDYIEAKFGILHYSVFCLDWSLLFLRLLGADCVRGFTFVLVFL